MVKNLRDDKGYLEFRRTIFIMEIDKEDDKYSKMFFFKNLVKNLRDDKVYLESRRTIFIMETFLLSPYFADIKGDNLQKILFV